MMTNRFLESARRFAQLSLLTEATVRIQRTLRERSRELGAAPGPAFPYAPARPYPLERAATERVDVGVDAPMTSHVYAQAGQRLAYRVFAPPEAAENVPLIVMLHGCTQTPESFAAATQMNELAARARCIVAYPEQSRAANASLCWNWFRATDQQRDAGEPAAIAGVTREVIAAHRCDPTRVYIAGLSSGGAMAAVMAATYPDLYAAAGVHSGLAHASATDVPSAFAAMRGAPHTERTSSDRVTSPVPIIIFQGDADRTVHPINAERLVRQNGDGETWIESTEAHPATAHEYAFRRTLYRSAAGNTVMEQWLVHGGGHAWFGGKHGESYADARGPNASEELMRFFTTHRR